MTDRNKSRASTHAADCWSWGQGHYECAVREIRALQAEVERLNQTLGRIVEGDGDSTLTIRAGADAFAAAREYLSAQLEDTNGARLPTWQDMLGDAEQLVRQKPTFSKYIRGTVLENDVPVWIATFAQRLLLRELTRLALHVRAAALEDAADAIRERLGKGERQ